jgi:DNA processing protein
MTNINNRQALLGFSYFKKIGPSKLSVLEKFFSNAYSAFWTNIDNLEKAGLNQKLAKEFIAWRQKINFSTIEEELKREQINFVTWHDPAYPALLKEICAAPYVLYFRGNLETLEGKEKNRLAIVGSRKHSAYAEKVLSNFLPILLTKNLEIISGLALGVDSLAHQAALNGGGRTIAVLGSGLDKISIYPRSNYRLSQEIIKSGGLLISEFPPKTPALKQNFPQRNRIISGLAQATLVIEAKEKSGALITARYALEQNREVLAIPGNIFSEFSSGPNQLIKMGAKTIISPEDILETFNLETDEMVIQDHKNIKNILPYPDLKSEVERMIYKILCQAQAKAERITTDEIIKITKLDTAVINSTLSILELRGVAKSDEIGYAVN